MMKALIAMLAALPVLALAPHPASADDLHARLLTVDTHVDIPLDFATPALDPGTLQPWTQWDIAAMEAGDVDAVFLVVYTRQGPRDAAGFRTAWMEGLTRLDAIHRMLDVHGDRVALARSADEIATIREGGRRAILIGIENGYVLGEAIDRLDMFHARGVRYLGLTHNGHNQLADSAVLRQDLGDADTLHGGLSDLGRVAVDRANDLGILIDLAHAAEATIMEVVERSRAPVVSTHHALKAFVDIPRNMSDAELEAIAATGGVVQIVALDSFVRPVPDARRAALRALAAEWGIWGPVQVRDLPEEKRPVYMAQRAAIDAQWPPGDLDDVIDQIDHAVARVGIDHVGLASDFDGGGGVTGWQGAEESPAVTAALQRRGYSEAQIAQLWGGNFLRVMREVEAAARR